MAWKIFTAMSFCLMIFISSTIAPATNAEQQISFEEYFEDLRAINQEIMEFNNNINKVKIDQSTYEQSLNLLSKLAIFAGTTHNVILSLPENEHTLTFRSLLEDTMINEFSQNFGEDLQEMGYSEEDIENIKQVLLEYNDYYHRVSTQGFSAEEITKMQEEGYSDADIELIKQKISERYVSQLNQKQMLESSKNEILQTQILLSLLSLKIIDSLPKKQDDEDEEQDDEEDEDQNEEQDEKIKHLREEQKRILKEIESLPSGKKHKVLEHIKAGGKQIYKLAGNLIRHGATVEEFGVDYFVGLQLNLAAETALNGDEDFGVNEIMAYRSVIEQLSGRLVVAMQTIEQPTTILQTQQQVGQVEESDETNNVAEIRQKVASGIFDLILQGSFPVAAIVIMENASIPGTFTIIEIPGIGQWIAIIIGVFLVLMILGIIVKVTIDIYEWPSKIPNDITKNPHITTDIEVDKEAILHIYMRAYLSSEKCERSSHKAIIENSLMIANTILNPTNIFMRGSEFIYYLFDGKNEWMAFIRNGRLTSAYRVDCAPPYKCSLDPSNLAWTIIEKWTRCQGFELIWPR